MNHRKVVFIYTRLVSRALVHNKLQLPLSILKYMHMTALYVKV